MYELEDQNGTFHNVWDHWRLVDVLSNAHCNFNKNVRMEFSYNRIDSVEKFNFMSSMVDHLIVIHKTDVGILALSASLAPMLKLTRKKV